MKYWPLFYCFLENSRAMQSKKNVIQLSWYQDEVQNCNLKNEILKKKTLSTL